MLVVRAYDVGDCVYFADDCQQYYCYVVSRINILTTVSNGRGRGETREGGGLTGWLTGNLSTHVTMWKDRGGQGEDILGGHHFDGRRGSGEGI